jgi:DNA-binding SARP family transcriptional activator
MPRERLTALRSRLADQRVVLTVAPAGSGKTTFLAQLTADAEGPVAWYWAESGDSAPEAFVGCLEQSFAAAIGTLTAGWKSADDVGLALDRWRGPHPLLVIDDFHVLQGSPAEETLERVLVRAPDLRVLIATRSLPGLNLSRLRVSNSLLEVGLNDLRFRSWEVEQLFRDFYGEPLSHEDLALLSRRTEGWAAALQLFHLATRGKQPAERRRTLDTLGSSSKLVREYLARNVLDELPQELREFMLETCVLGRLTGALCDELLESSGSRQLLEELERRQLFTYGIGADEEYRYHDFLRSHLEAVLVEELGQDEARKRYTHAGALLESAGAMSDALTAYCRGEDWSAANALLGREGERLAQGSPTWVDLIPQIVSANDPWLLLAEARRNVRKGMFPAALERYQQAEVGFGASGGRELARHERLALNVWLDPTTVPSSDWSGLLRRATVGEPLAVRQLAARELPPPHRSLVSGLSALLAGRVSEAIRALDDALQEPGASPSLLAAARLAGAVARILSGAVHGARAAESAAEDAEQLDLEWLARLGRTALVLEGRADGRREAASALQAFERHGDAWGAALTILLRGWGALASGRAATADLRLAVAEFERLRAEVLATWARSALALALARSGDPDARRAATTAEFCARSLGVPGAQAIALSALAESHPTQAARHGSAAAAMLDELSLVLPRRLRSAELAPRVHVTTAAALPSIEIHCFGGFGVAVHGEPVDLAKAKPRPRYVLHMLAVSAGRPVHREVLTEAVWPNAEPRAANRYLHVAISSLRRVLEPNGRRGGESLIAREAEAYRLALPDDARVDIVEFDRALAAARAAQRGGDDERSLGAYRAALDLYRGDLLPEDGPAEWLVEERERRSAEACEAAHAVARGLLERGEPAAATVACERGLHIDRFRDDLWRLCIRSHERTGDFAAASRARGEYRAVLSELGIAARPGARVPTSRARSTGSR